MHPHENTVYDLPDRRNWYYRTYSSITTTAGWCKKTIIAEAFNIGYGTTGGTSAHINTFADTTYAGAESAFGEKGARQFADAVNAGFNIIHNYIEQYHIDCDFEMKPGFVYAEEDKEVKQLNDMYEGHGKSRCAS